MSKFVIEIDKEYADHRTMGKILSNIFSNIEESKVKTYTRHEDNHIYKLEINEKENDKITKDTIGYYDNIDFIINYMSDLKKDEYYINKKTWWIVIYKIPINKEGFTSIFRIYDCDLNEINKNHQDWL